MLKIEISERVYPELGDGWRNFELAQEACAELYARLVGEALDGYVVAGAEHEQVEVWVDIAFEEGRVDTRQISITHDADVEDMSEEELEALESAISAAEQDIEQICSYCESDACRQMCEDYDDSAHPLEGEEDLEDEESEAA